jgi:dTDP-4-amino-4,6-dideoxygalactose transaminase
MIPLVDLKAAHRQVADEVQRGFAAVMENTSFIGGKEVAAFEQAYSAFTGVPHTVGVANGTDALELCLRALGVGAGDEVILPANTFIATALAVQRAGATPVLVDCDAEYQLIDHAQAAAKVGPRTKALMPVHLFGQCAPMEPLVELARSKNLHLIEDAAQAQGAKRHGKDAGGFGVMAGTSFYPGKNLGAYGDAGAVVTPSAELAKKVRALRNYGSEVKYFHPETGFNSRLDTLQAVVLSAKLKHLAKWNEQRRSAAKRYDELLARLPAVTRPKTLPGNEHVWHLYVVRVANRDSVLSKLSAAGVGAGVHYPVPIHLQGAFAHLGHKKGDFPVAEKAAEEILSLPMFPELTPAQQDEVVSALEKAIS